MAETINVFKVVGYFSFPLFLMVGVYLGFKKYKGKTDGSGVHQSADNTNSCNCETPDSCREVAPKNSDEKGANKLDLQIELERRRFAN